MCSETVVKNRSNSAKSLKFEALICYIASIDITPIAFMWVPETRLDSEQ